MIPRKLLAFFTAIPTLASLMFIFSADVQEPLLSLDMVMGNWISLTGYWSGSIRNPCSKSFGPCFLIEPCQYHVPLFPNPRICFLIQGSKLVLSVFSPGLAGEVTHGDEGKLCFIHLQRLLLS